MTWRYDKKAISEEYKKWRTAEYRAKKSEYDKKLYSTPEMKKKKRRRLKDRYWMLKIKFFTMYGDKCACCSESTKEFLTLEHKQGLNGQKRVRGGQLYKQATDEYRPDIYETLCMNCNHAIGRVGYCPHNPLRRDKE